jgi:multidrug efflux pump subunit AcrB
MVLYLLPAEMPLYQNENAPGGGPIWRVHQRFDRVFEWLRGQYRGLLEAALEYRLLTIALMLGFALGSFALFPRVGQDFFPEVDAGQIRLHARGPDGIRIEETEKLFGRVEDVIREVVPDSERGIILDNMGLTSSFTAIAYTDNGTVSDSDGEIMVSLKPNHRPTREYVARLREELPKRFPGCTFYFEPADITGQILNAGLPAPINVQVVGVNREANLAVAKKLRREVAKVPGAVDVHIHQMTEAP